MKLFFKKTETAFTLIELMVVISIIGILSSIVYASFGEARAQSRDKVRMSGLKELQLSIELYRAQVGRYPAKGCGGATDFAGPGPTGGTSGFASCAGYISSLVPDFIPALPQDPRFENDNNRGYYYRTDANGTAYKLMLFNVVESLEVTGVGDEFARCPSAAPGGACASGIPTSTYAVYSAGAENW